ncbi:MAG TPA: hypothetical protein RMH99_11050 [Sandaracinaceae bacterium LLY-WYZ-13_1]|nr:hypothetical protein [Sandaracinaceae bacterium LLY-WYZ-13_1]
MRGPRTLLFGLLVVLLGGCEPVIPEGRFACVEDDDCPPGQVCRTRVSRCYETGVDAGPPPVDAGARDAAPPDAGSLDAGSPDAGSLDAAATDGATDAS